MCLFTLLIGCQTTENKIYVSQDDHKNYFNDNAFQNYLKIRIETENEIFTLSDEMKQMVANDVAPVRDLRERAIKLVTKIFDTKTK